MENKTLNDYFSKIYVINLDKRQDRYLQVQKEFEKIGANVTRYPGIDGSKLTPPFGIRQGAYGLLLTHLRLIEEAYAEKYDSIVIFEDDVIFIDNFNKHLNEKIQYLPNNWDFLYLGGNHILHVDGFKSLSGDQNFKITKENYKTLNHDLCKTPCTYCAHALAINSRIYERILNKLKSDKPIPVDNVYYTIQMEGCNAYAFLPSLAIQRPSFSDIENMYVDYGSMSPVNF